MVFSVSRTLFRALIPTSLLLLACTGQPAATPTAPTARLAPEVGALAPEFTVPTLEGSTVSLSALRGRPLVLNFWASWCGPCVSEMPHLQSVWEQSAGSDLALLAMNMGESEDTVRRFMASHGLTFTVGLDPENRVANAYGIYAIPTTFFIDRSGVIRQVKVGAFSSEGDIWAGIEGIR